MNIIKKGNSSANIEKLFKNYRKYQKILNNKKQFLIKKYPNKDLEKIFSFLPLKLLSIGPMAICDYISLDISSKSANSEILAGIGLSCFTLSVHDDVVDETPHQRATLAGLVYSGNISALEGIKIFLSNFPKKKDSNKVLDILIENHYKQQWRINLAWDKKPKNLNQYKKAIEDVNSLVMIATTCALTLTNTESENINKSLKQFAASYAIILQLVDDIREVDEDKINGYNSFSLSEGVPFIMSFKEIYKQLSLARNSIPHKWNNIHTHLNLVEKLVKKLQLSYGSR